MPDPSTRADEAQSAVDLDELERLAKAAPPGPWTAEYWCDGSEGGVDVSPSHYVDLKGGDGDLDDFIYLSEADAAFVAAATPQTVLALIARLRALSGAVPTYDDIQRALTPFVNHWHRPDAVRAVLAILPVAGVPPEQGGGVR